MPSVVLKGVTISYPRLFVPHLRDGSPPGAKARYEAQFLIPKGFDLKELTDACNEALAVEWGDKVHALVKNGALNIPINKKTINKEGNPRFNTSKFEATIQAWSYNQPGVFDRWAGDDGKLVAITNPDKVYPGAIVCVSVSPFIYKQQGNQGVALGLNNVQFWEDGPRLDNRADPQKEFQAERRPDAELNGASPSGTGSKGAGLADLLAS